MSTLELGIPAVDLNQFKNGNETQKFDFIKSLGKAYEDIGFVAVKNHGVSDELIEELYTQVKAFFNMPKHQKQSYEIEGIAGQRGYVSFGKEHAKGRNTGDLKEFWHFGQYVEDGDAIQKDYPENVKVKELPKFNEVGKQAYQALENTGKDILRALALFLEFDENYFDDKIHNGNSILRPIHYPPIEGEPKDAVRAGEHEDINLITLLIGASADGLQVLNKNNEWVSVTALKEHIIVNVGDMLQRLTNNKLRSTTHRVVNPPRDQWHTSRFSIPFFLHPRSEMRLDCMESCIDQDHPKQYSDISAGEYLEQRLKEIGLKK